NLRNQQTRNGSRTLSIICMAVSGFSGEASGPKLAPTELSKRPDQFAPCIGGPPITDAPGRKSLILPWVAVLARRAFQVTGAFATGFAGSLAIKPASSP